MKKIILALIVVLVFPVLSYSTEIIQHPQYPDLLQIKDVVPDPTNPMRGEIITVADNVAINPSDGELYKDVMLVKEYDKLSKKYKYYKDFSKATKIDKHGHEKAITANTKKDTGGW